MDDFADDAVAVGVAVGLREVEGVDGIEDGARLRGVGAVGDVSGGKCEDVTAVKGGTDFFGGVLRVGNGVHLFEGMGLGEQSEEAVVGADHGLSSEARDDGQAVCADAGIDDDDMQRIFGVPGDGCGEEEGAFDDSGGGDFVGEINDFGRAALAEDDAFYGGGIGVSGAEVGCEGDEGAHGRVPFVWLTYDSRGAGAGKGGAGLGGAGILPS